LEIGELMSVLIPGQDVEAACPFAHKQPEVPEQNELGGIGTTLGKNMAEGKGVLTTATPAGGDYTEGEKDPDPRDRSDKITFVVIKVGGETVLLAGETLPYPVTCAAHHLIPAQESLKGHAILKFMCKYGDQQDFRSSGDAAPGKVAGSKVWGNVAYNVNGRQNGVWLPGNYAVGAGTGGVEIWKSRATDKRKTYSNQEAAEKWISKLDLSPDEWKQLARPDPNEEEGPQPAALQQALTTAALPKYMLAGKNFHIDDSNPKWAYVKSAMDKVGGQFHDRHEAYSNEVKNYLTKIAEAYEVMYERSTQPQGGCEECAKAKRPAGAKASHVGPPYGIVKRLVSASDFFKRYVHAQIITAYNIFTSKWVLAWMNTRL